MHSAALKGIFTFAAFLFRRYIFVQCGSLYDRINFYHQFRFINVLTFYRTNATDFIKHAGG